MYTGQYPEMKSVASISLSSCYKSCNAKTRPSLIIYTAPHKARACQKTPAYNYQEIMDFNRKVGISKREEILKGVNA